MSTFVSLEDAAKKLGVSTEQLIEMRSRGEIFGYRDGASWKFKPEEIQRVASELMGDVLEEDPAGSSILNLDPENSQSASSLSSSASGLGLLDTESDVKLQVDPNSSDLRLVASSDVKLDDQGEGSGFSDVNEDGLRLANSDDDDDELGIDSEEEIVTGSDGELSLDSDAKASSVDLIGSEIKLAEHSDLIRGDSDPAIGTGSSGVGSDVNLDDDLELVDDVVLGSGSDLALGADSGINLMSPADSGISLEDEPLDLAASGISGLDLAAEGSGAGGSGLGSGVDFQQDEDFQLSPSGGLEVDDDSGSQVIELEDSSEVAPALAGEGLDAFGDLGAGGDAAFDSADAFGEMAPAVGAAVVASPEVPFSTLQVVTLLLILLVMTFSGILMSDIVRNLWAWTPGNESVSDLTSGLTRMLVGK
jgi:hypothetical protein